MTGIQSLGAQPSRVLKQVWGPKPLRHQGLRSWAGGVCPALPNCLPTRSRAGGTAGENAPRLGKHPLPLPESWECR